MKKASVTRLIWLDKVKWCMMMSVMIKVYYLGAKAWNSLPIDLRNMSDPKVFGKNLNLVY